MNDAENTKNTDIEEEIDIEDEKVEDMTPKADEEVPSPVTPRPTPSPETARLAYCSFAEMRPAPGSKYAPMGLFGYIAILVLTLIPGLGFIIAAVIACASKKLARKRLALAIVLIQAFVIVTLGVLAIVAVYAFDAEIAGMLYSVLG